MSRKTLIVLIFLLSASSVFAQRMMEIENFSNGSDNRRVFALGFDVLSFGLSMIMFNNVDSTGDIVIRAEAQYSYPSFIWGIFLGMSMTSDYIGQGFHYDIMPGMSLNPQRLGITGFGVKIFPIIRMYPVSQPNHYYFGAGAEAYYTLLIPPLKRMYVSPYAGVHYVFGDMDNGEMVFEILKFGVNLGYCF